MDTHYGSVSGTEAGEGGLPLRAFGLGVAALAAASGLAFVTAIGGRHVGAPVPLRLGVAEVVLWAVLGGTALRVSRRLGTGRLADDVGLRVRLIDPATAVLVLFTSYFAVIPVGLLIRALGPRFRGTNTGVFLSQRADRVGLAVVAAIAVIGAPIIEEVFFRGLLLRSLTGTLGTAPAIVGQAALFGLAHANPYYGLRNLSLILGTGTLGLVFGIVATRVGRLGPTIFAHAFYNAVVMAVVLRG